MTSTLLFIDGHPVPYIIEPAGDHFKLYPFHDVHPEVVPPRITARPADGHWLIEGSDSQDLKDQVVEDLENYLKQKVTA